MRAVRIERPGELRLVELPSPVPGRAEALVRVAYAGICHSDVDLLAGRRPVEYARFPVVPGHEWSGTVIGTGDDADRGLIGSKVVGRGFVACGACPACAAGDETLCAAEYDEIGFTRQGAWAELMVIPARQLHVLDAGVNLRSAAGLEPAACAADAVMRAGLGEHDRVAVVGAGAIGCLVIQLVSALSPRELLVVEPDEDRRPAALRCGASRAVAAAARTDVASGYDVVIEAAGVAAAARTAFDLARRGGRVVLTGMFGDDASVSARDIVHKRLSIESVFGAPPSAWRYAGSAFEAGTLDPGLLVTHVLPLEAAGQGLALLAERSELVGKVLLVPAESSVPGSDQPSW